MVQYVMHFKEIDKSLIQHAGGKGANLGEMTKAGFPIPPGFCITTAAYQTVVDHSPEINELIEQLKQFNDDSKEKIKETAKQIRDQIQLKPIRSDIASDISKACRELGSENAYAVRSSATAEDLPDVSFAGQQDTYLNVKGEEQLFEAVKKCWASLYSDRAILYRMRNGFDHRAVKISVVVQKMINPEISGVMFTADPVTGNRHTISIDASFGLGEAIVSGLVSPDLYQVRFGEIVKKQVSKKETAIVPSSNGGVVSKEIPFNERKKQALTDDKIVELANLGKSIEKHYGREQDIEWCFINGQFYIVQTRPITTLYPVPEALDHHLRVFLSFGHQQMMTDPISPAGISLWKLIVQHNDNPSRLVEAGGRLFIDYTNVLNSEQSQFMIPLFLKSMDESMSRSLLEVMRREAFHSRSVGKPEQTMISHPVMATKILKDLIEGENGETANDKVEAFRKKSLINCQSRLEKTNGPDRIEAIEEESRNLLKNLGPHDIHYAVSGMIADNLLKTLAKLWLEDTEDIQCLFKSLPNNVTGEMGLMIGDLADTARSYPELVQYLETAREDSFYDGLESVKGGAAFRKELDRFLQLYGMRCPGEIDLASMRWYENPYMLVSSILGHTKNVKPGEHRKRFLEGEIEAKEARERIISSLRHTKDGSFKVKIMSHVIDVYRNFMGLREHHKFVIIQHLDLFKRAILKEAETLVEKDILQTKNDVFFLKIQELKELLKGELCEDVRQLIASRKAYYNHYKRLTPPRVITSEGEVIIARKEEPEAIEGLLYGTPVSPGVAEGYAKVVLDPSRASLKPNEILVAPFTDPGWTPLFQQAKGLVMEVGGLMTHGTVVAREFGIPAVVGVDKATKEIKSGQFIRVDGARGEIAVLESPDAAVLSTKEG